MIEQMSLFPNVREVLETLNRFHYKTCIISDLTADIQIKKLMKLEISQYIDYLVTSEETGTDKPLPNQLELALDKLKLTRDDVIIVGNSLKTDIELGKRENVKTVLFDYHKDHEEEKSKPDFYITDFKEIEDIIDVPLTRYSNEKMVIFDLIGTISPAYHLVSIVLSDLLKQSPDEIRPAYEKYKTGEIQCEEFWKIMGVVDYKQMESELIRKLSPRKAMLKVLEILKQKYRLVILSNIPKEWGYAVVKQYKLDKYFEKFYFSGELKLKKPNPEIYKRVISDYKNINPENIYFVEDELEDLSSGKNLLMQTIWFRKEDQEVVCIPDYVINNEMELLRIL